MSFFSNIADAVTNVAKTEVDGLKKIFTQNPVTSAKEAVSGAVNLAKDVGGSVKHNADAQTNPIMKAFAWTPWGAPTIGLLNVAKDGNVDGTNAR